MTERRRQAQQQQWQTCCCLLLQIESFRLDQLALGAQKLHQTALDGSCGRVVLSQHALLHLQRPPELRLRLVKLALGLQLQRYDAGSAAASSAAATVSCLAAALPVSSSITRSGISIAAGTAAPPRRARFSPRHRTGRRVRSVGLRTPVGAPGGATHKKWARVDPDQSARPINTRRSLRCFANVVFAVVFEPRLAVWGAPADSCRGRLQRCDMRRRRRHPTAPVSSCVSRASAWQPEQEGRFLLIFYRVDYYSASGRKQMIVVRAQLMQSRI